MMQRGESWKREINASARLSHSVIVGSSSVLKVSTHARSEKGKSYLYISRYLSLYFV